MSLVPVSAITADDVSWAMAFLLRKTPEDVEDLATIGAMDEPFCGVCSVLIPTYNERLPGWKQASVILDYHDQWIRGEKDLEDAVHGTGLAGVCTYLRCLEIYEIARSTWQARR